MTLVESEYRWETREHKNLLGRKSEKEKETFKRGRGMDQQKWQRTERKDRKWMQKTQNGSL